MMTFDYDRDRGDMADDATGLDWPDPYAAEPFRRITAITDGMRRMDAAWLLLRYAQQRVEVFHVDLDGESSTFNESTDADREDVECMLATAWDVEDFEHMAAFALALHELGIFKVGEWTEYAKVAAVLLARDNEQFEATQERLFGIRIP